MRVRAPEFGQQLVELLRLWHDRDGAHEGFERGRVRLLQAGTEQVTDMDNTDEVVQGLAINRIARVGRVERLLDRLVGREVDLQCDNVGSRDHHLTCLGLGKIEDLVEQLAFFGFEHALFVRGRDQQLEFFLRMDEAHLGGRLETHQADQCLAQPAQHPDKRPEEPHKDGHRQHDGERYGLGARERQRLRHDLA